MNASYNWTNAERMVAERMKEMQREAEVIRRLRNAGLAKPGLYGWAAVAFGSTLVKLGHRLLLKYDHSRPAGQTAGSKYAV